MNRISPDLETANQPAAGSSGRVAILRCSGHYELPVRREAEAFRDAGFDVDVIQLASDDAPAGATVDVGVNIIRLDGSRRRNVSRVQYLLDYMSFIIAAGRRLNSEHKRRKYDLVQVNTMPDFLFLATLWVKARGARVSIFMKEPTPELGYTLSGSRRVEQVFRVIERVALKYADVAFTVTDELKATYAARGADASKIHVVLNCPDIRHLEADVEPRVDESKFVMLCHGTVELRYGHDVMLDAIKLVRDRVPNVQLRISGKGDHLAEIERRIQDEDLSEHVVSLGWIEMDELLAELRGADAGIVCQMSSPYSNLVHTNKMFEYIMVGIPCISARLRAVEGSFSDEALIYFEPDSAESLADAIVRLHDDPELGRTAVTSARAHYDAGYQWSDQRTVLIGESVAALNR